MRLDDQNEAEIAKLEANLRTFSSLGGHGSALKAAV